MTADSLPYFLGGMLTGISLTVVLSAIAIGFYKSEVRRER